MSFKSRVRLWQTVTVALDNFAPPDHDRMRASGLNALMNQHLLDAARRAGQKAWTALHDQSHIFGMKRIDVLQGRNRVEDRFFMNLSR